MDAYSVGCCGARMLCVDVSVVLHRLGRSDPCTVIKRGGVDTDTLNSLCCVIT